MSPQSFLWILFFVPLLSTSTSTPNAYELDKSSCRLELIQHSLHRCRPFLRHGPQRAPLLLMTTDASDNEGAPEECCAQLRQVREGCRCRGIREMVQEVKWEEGFRGRECRGRCGEMLMRGQLLPAMCSVEPHRCKMTQGVGYNDDE